jgi:hypothetical protein
VPPQAGLLARNLEVESRSELDLARSEDDRVVDGANIAEA